MIQADTPIVFQSFAPISRDQLRAYADASGDFNPIHLDEEVAKSVGLPGIIAHGMLIAALVAERANQFMDRESGTTGYRLIYFQTRFKAMTFLGDTPSVGGSVKLVKGDEVTLDLQAKSQRGDVTLIGTARFSLFPC